MTAQPNAALETVLDVPLDAVEPDPEQPRRLFDEDDLAVLTDSIRSTGLVQPITLVPNEPGSQKPYRILVGERRWRACQRAGLATVRATVRHDLLTPTDRLMIQLVENDDRSPLTLFERALAVKRALEHSGLSKRRFASQYRKSPAWLSSLLSVAEAEGPTLDAFREDLLRHSETGRLFSKLPDKVQAQILTRARETRLPITMSVVQSAVDREDAKRRKREEMPQEVELLDGEEPLGHAFDGPEPPAGDEILAPVVAPTFGRGRREPHVAFPLTRRRAEVLLEFFDAEPDTDSLEECASLLGQLADSHQR